VKTFKLTGLILAEKELGDFDKIFSVLTKDKGKIFCLARGIKRPKAKYKSILEIFNSVHLDLFKGKSFFYVTQARTIESRRELKSSYEKISVCFFVFELIDVFLQENHSIPKIFTLLGEFLEVVEKEENP